MNLLDRFSSHLRDVLARSIHLAAELKNVEVEPIHLFFAVSNQHGSVATEIINRLNVTPKSIEQALLNLPVRKVDVLHARASSTTEQVLTPLSQNTKAVLEKAMTVAQENNHNYIGTEHLLAALVDIEDPTVIDILQINAVDLDELDKQIDTVLANATHFPHLTEVADVVKKIEETASPTADADEEVLQIPTPGNKTQKKGKESALEFFATNLTNPKIQKNIDPVVGRENEIERVIQILCRRTKNNPLLLGEPGVGKTAIVEGLAKKIVEGKVPDILLNKKIYAVDMSMLIAGTIYRGEFEARLRQVIEEAINNPNIILFIDELHNIVGTGSNQGTMDAANILKPPLSRGQLRCIGATTPPEFKKYIENDAALERRFQTVYAKEPSVEDTVSILQGVKKNYELYHKVSISDEAILAAVRLSERYITNKFLPDKAIDLLDETAAAKRLNSKNHKQSKLARLEQKLEKTLNAKEVAASNDKFEEAVKLKKEEEKIRQEIKLAAQESKEKEVTLIGTVSERDVLEQVGKIIGTKPSDLLLDDKSALDGLQDRLSEYIVGQDDVLKEVSKLIRQARLGLSNPERPLASFMFVGESGVGKTELAKTLAKVLYANHEAFIKLDMSEFNESFGVSKLLGSPAGYIGYKEGTQFTDRIKMNPHCVILFDEIDKAHKDIIKLLLQMLENGEITDSTGKKISLKHAVVILTTSYGADEIKKGSFGFGRSVDAPIENRLRMIDKLKEFFSPEVINRLDRICFFEPLKKETLTKLAELELKRFNEQLYHYRTKVSSDKKVLEWVVNQLPNANSGARDVRRFVREHVESLMSEIILGRKIKKSYTLTVNNNNLLVK